ncbi:MAG: helix-turn-helix domain-containing protein [Lachnospiraceae bacterium]|nr:helix-turn-helix domain-containing protein [Lachnospiraceae bacterium]
MQWILSDIPLGRNIKRARLRKNMTQKDTVEKMRTMGSIMSRSALANIETGRRNIKANDLKLLKLILDVNYDEFFQDMDTEKP